MAMTQLDTSKTWILAGPTASGKTALALALAQEVDIEIISVDSALIYRGMDIGTAKPTQEEQAQVPHHLIDILDPLESYSAARFVADAEQLMTDIRARGKTPLLVGGTMLYIKALMEGLDDMPPADPTVRQQLDERMAQEGPQGLHQQLQQVDPITAARLAPGDSQRIQRALEVWYTTGQPLSAFHSRKDPEALQAKQAQTVLISLEPNERSWLHERIALRYRLMMEQGFVQEVEQLRQRGDLHLNLPSMRCVGYRQVWEALDAGMDLTRTADRAKVMEQGIAATRQLAKRQITWLRSMPWRKPLACDQGVSVSDVMALLA